MTSATSTADRLVTYKAPSSLPRPSERCILGLALSSPLWTSIKIRMPLSTTEAIESAFTGQKVTFKGQQVQARRSAEHPAAQVHWIRIGRCLSGRYNNLHGPWSAPKHQHQNDPACFFNISKTLARLNTPTGLSQIIFLRGYGYLYNPYNIIVSIFFSIIPKP